MDENPPGKTGYPLTAFVLSLGGRCNNRCSICLCGNKKTAPVSTDDILCSARKMSPHFDGFLLADGEPTLIDSLPELLNEINELAPRILQVHTNARMFAYSDYAAQFRETRGVDFVVRVYSHDPQIHDSITGVDGSFVQAMKGIRNLSENVSGRCGIHVELPLMRDAPPDAPSLFAILKHLDIDSLLITGGYPAVGAANIVPAEAAAFIRECRSLSPGIPVHSHYAAENHFVEGKPAAHKSDKSGKWFIGADTNNPFVFRGRAEDGPRALLISPPNTPGMNVRVFLAAPAAIAALNGFLELLGYDCDMIDLEMHPEVRAGALNEFCDAERIMNAENATSLDTLLRDAAGKMLAPYTPGDYSVVGISAADFIQTYIAVHLAAYIRAAAPDTHIAVGPLRTEDRGMFEGNADYICEPRIFGEYYLAGLMNRIEFGDRCNVAIYGNNVSSLSDKGFFLNMMCDMKHLPCPSYGTLDTARYQREMTPGLKEFLGNKGIAFDPGARIGFAMYYSSRGCRHKCSCCGNQYALSQRNPVLAARYAASIEAKTGLKAFFMLDTAINNNQRFLLEFCEELVRIGSPILWMVSARPDFESSEIPQLMRQAGCVMLTLGVETGSDFILGKLNKRFNIETAEKSLEWITSAGIMAAINLMSGYINEREEDVQATRSFIHRNRDRIDFIGDHTSFVWYEGIRVTEKEAGVRFRPGLWRTPQGPSRIYDEIDGRSWEQIIEFKKQAFLEIEECISEFNKYEHSVREYDIFHIYLIGRDRRLAREYLEHLSIKGHGKANYIFDDWMKYFIHR